MAEMGELFLQCFSNQSCRVIKQCRTSFTAPPNWFAPWRSAKQNEYALLGGGGKDLLQITGKQAGNARMLNYWCNEESILQLQI